MGMNYFLFFIFIKSTSSNNKKPCSGLLEALSEDLGDNDYWFEDFRTQEEFREVFTSVLMYGIINLHFYIREKSGEVFVHLNDILKISGIDEKKGSCTT